MPSILNLFMKKVPDIDSAICMLLDHFFLIDVVGRINLEQSHYSTTVLKRMVQKD